MCIILGCILYLFSVNRKIVIMRKYLFILAMIGAVAQYISAQSRSIIFEQSRSWAKAVKKAKTEKKLIFVDCYASWSGPCKRLATQVFTQDKVADFFNEHFVNVQFDMEKDPDGKARLQPWGVASFPTLMFIDPATEQPVGKLVGAGDADWLIEGAKSVLDPSKRIDALAERYNKGERSEAFILDFIKALNQAGMTAQVQQVVKEWLESLPIDRLATKEIWPIIMQFENDPLSKTLLAVKEHMERFYAIPSENQRAMVDAKLAGAMVQTAMEFSTSPNLAAYNQARYNAFVDYLAQMPDSPGKAAASVWLNTSLLSRQGNWKQMLAVMRAVKEENILPEQIYGQYFVFFMKSLTQMKEKEAAVTEGSKWLDELIAGEKAETPDAYRMRASLYAAKATLWQEVGKNSEVKKAQKEMEKYVELLKKTAAEPAQGNPLQGNPTLQAGIPAGGKAVLNYEERVGVPVVKVMINGHTYSFLFDTCAGYTCVSDKLVNTEKLAYQQTGNTVIGMQGTLNMAVVPELTMGGLTLKNQVAAVMSEQNPAFQTLGIDGIIGAPIINNYVVIIDSRSKMITLSGETDATIVRWDTLSLHGSDPLLAIKVQGKDELYDVPALFDTGNGTGAIALPSAQGFEEWAKAGVIGHVEKGEGFNAVMIGGISKTTDKLYRGSLTGFHIGDGAFKEMSIMTGGMDYLLMPFKISDLGKMTLDYPRKRFNFTAYPGANVWAGDRRPVLTGVVDGVLKVAAVWGDEAAKSLKVGDTIAAIGDKTLENLPTNAPNIDVLIGQSGAATVKVKDAKGKEKELPVGMFLVR